MYEILLGLFLVIALALIGIILLQQGKGADLGASFGAGASNTVFGAAGSGNFLTKATWWLALVSLVILLVLGYMASHRDKAAAVTDDVFAEAPAADLPATEATAVPATDVPAATEAAPVNSDVPAAPAATEQPASDAPKP
ncbi:MAG: preprotein translocase subunit SecG [Pseudomonadota bacterium]